MSAVITEVPVEKANVENVEQVGDIKRTEFVHQVVVTAEDDKRLRRKTDKYLLPLLIWVYFLQIYDKSVFGYGNTYGLSKNLKLATTDYSLASSMTSIATLAWQPFSAYLVV